MVRRDQSCERHAERTGLQWAVLAAAFAVTVTAAPAQAQIEAAPAPTAEEQTFVVLEADVLIDDDETNTITAEGNVQARYQNRTLRADRIVYTLDTGSIRAIGGVEIIEADGSVRYADEVEVDEELRLGVATDLQARFNPQGALAARTAVRRDEGRSQLNQVVYTSCPLCEDGERPPTWALRARRAVQDTQSRMISYRDAVLEVAGVPVFYTPYFAHPDPTAGPRSGLLTPDGGRNRRLGAFVELPYYWRISDNQDLTITPRVHEQVNPLLGLEYRKRFWSGDLRIEGTVTQEQDFDSDGEKFGDDTVRSHVFAQGRFVISDYWRWGFGVERTSDDLYLRRYGLSGAGETRGPFIGDFTRLISQAYVQGQDARSFVNVTTISFQGLREGDTSELLPVILPLAEVSRTYDEPFLDGQVRVQATSAVLERSGDAGVDSARVSGDVSWRRSVIAGPGVVVTPFVQGRVDLYRFGENAALGREEETLDRTVGVSGVEISWPFVRVGEAVSVTVEPVVMGALGSQGGDDPRIVNEDSIAFELDESSLFRANGAPNFDLWEPGGRVSAGVRATARTDGGLTAGVIAGRRWRDEEAAAFGPESNLNETQSDWVGGVFVDVGERFGAEVRTRADGESLELRRVDAALRGRIWRVDGNVRYLSVDSEVNAGVEVEEVSARVGARLTDRWRVDFGMRRDLASAINLTESIALTYLDDCSFLEIAYTRSETFDRRLGPNEGLRIRVGLTTLGVLGGGD